MLSAKVLRSAPSHANASNLVTMKQQLQTIVSAGISPDSLFLVLFLFLVFLFLLLQMCSLPSQIPGPSCAVLGPSGFLPIVARLNPSLVAVNYHMFNC